MANHPKPTPMQAKALELIRQGVRPKAAMKQAGYSEETASAPKRNLLSSPGARVLIEQQLSAYAAVGITPDYLAEKTKELIDDPNWMAKAKGMDYVRHDFGLSQDAETKVGVGVAIQITRGEGQ